MIKVKRKSLVAHCWLISPFFKALAESQPVWFVVFTQTVPQYWSNETPTDYQDRCPLSRPVRHLIGHTWRCYKVDSISVQRVWSIFHGINHHTLLCCLKYTLHTHTRALKRDINRLSNSARSIITISSSIYQPHVITMSFRLSLYHHIEKPFKRLAVKQTDNTVSAT